MNFSALFFHLKMYLHDNLILKTIKEGLVNIVTALILHIADRS